MKIFAFTLMGIYTVATRPETGPEGRALTENRTVMIMKCESSPLNHSGSSSYISELFQIFRKYRKLMIHLLLFPLISKDQVLGPEETLIPIKMCMQMYESYSQECLTHGSYSAVGHSPTADECHSHVLPTKLFTHCYQG